MRSVAGLGQTIPALPVRNVRTAASHYGDRFGFEAVHLTDGFAVVIRDEAVIHLWAAPPRTAVGPPAMDSPGPGSLGRGNRS